MKRKIATVLKNNLIVCARTSVEYFSHRVTHATHTTSLKIVSRQSSIVNIIQFIETQTYVFRHPLRSLFE